MPLSPPRMFMPCTRGLVSPAGVHIGIALASTWQLAQRGCVTTASIFFQASRPSARLTLPGGSASFAASPLATPIPMGAAIDEAANAIAIRDLFMARSHTKSMNLLKGILRIRFPVAAISRSRARVRQEEQAAPRYLSLWDRSQARELR